MPRLALHRPKFALLSDDARLPDPRPLLNRLPPGAWVIFRNYRASGRAESAAALAQACRARRLVLLVAGDFDLAVRLGAGLHLPEGMARRMPPRILLWRKRTKRLLTVAAHSRAALNAKGADAALLSPLFATASHPESRPLGLLRFRRLVRGARLPVVALGGITAKTVRQIQGSGAAGIATVGGLAAGLDPNRRVAA
jgi:thiamine-phosphate pyrophosphorylase